MEQLVDIARQRGTNIPSLQTKPRRLHCKIHGDYDGFVTEINGQTVEGGCPICFEEEQRLELISRNEELRKRQAQAEVEAAMRRSSVPRLFQTQNFANYNPTCPEAEEAKKKLLSYVENYQAVAERGSNILLVGNTGTGKTTLACAVVNELLQKGVTAMYSTSYQICRHIRSTWVNGSEISHDELVKKYCAPSVLVIDEIGKGDNTKVNKNLLFEVINERYYQCLPTISISLYFEDKLRKMFEPDFIRRLSFRGVVIGFTWERYDDGKALPL